MKKIDWHSGFVNAMKLELLANAKQNDDADSFKRLVLAAL